MKVILNQTVPKVGKQGQVVTVADGYARNFLFPRGYATLATREQLKALEARHARLAAKDADAKSAAESVKAKLDGLSIKIEGKVGADQGKLFGAITSQNVTDAIKSQLGVELDRKQVGVVEPFKKLGEYKIPIGLHRDVDASVTLTIFDPNAPVEAEAPVAEEAPAE